MALERTGQTSAERKAERLAREEHAIELAASGIPMAQIAQQLGVSRGSAYRIVNRALDRRRTAPTAATEQRREMEGLRLRRLFEKHHARLERLLAASEIEDNEDALLGLGQEIQWSLDYGLRIHDRIAKLYGLAVPVAQQLDLGVNMAADMGVLGLLEADQDDT